MTSEIFFKGQKHPGNLYELKTITTELIYGPRTGADQAQGSLDWHVEFSVLQNDSHKSVGAHIESVLDAL